MMDHPFAPVFNKHSRILILGTFPSAKSREYGFYYGHPRNRFWQIIARLTKANHMPAAMGDKKQMLLESGIALWDIVKSCHVDGSRDSGLTNIVPNDLSIILEKACIRKIFANGNRAHNLCKAHPIVATKLPSTSPANARYNLEMLVQKWNVILDAMRS
jgi:hypoxanthine-DNA glycosylase